MSHIDLKAEEKIKKLREYYTDEDSQKALLGIEKRLRDNLLKAGIPNLPLIKEIVKSGQKKIDGINTLLLHDENLTLEMRNKLFERRDAHQFYVDRLSGKHDSAVLDNLNSMLDERLASIENVDTSSSKPS